MATTSTISPSISTVSPVTRLVSVRRPLVFTGLIAPVLLWLLWEVLSK